ncbi:hypothetical protein AAVH_41809 [Aphelenchoides avenae]|nr:hypothetical protein AAVH_41809 [Aphelenchus avenae]
MQSGSDARKQLVVVGGGVAGVCCVEELEGLVEDGSYGQADITLICGIHGFIKTVTNAEQLTQLMVSFDVAESSAEAFFESRNVRVVQDDVVA